MSRSFVISLVLVALLGPSGCVLPTFDPEGKWCREDDRCPDGFSCVPLPGQDHGQCAAQPPSCPGAPVGDACTVGVGACRREGSIICSFGGATCSEVPGAAAAESCNGVDDDCDGEVDDVAGCTSSLAGAGPPGFVDGPAETAQFGLPSYLNLDAAGNVLVADAFAHAIRRVDPSGTVTTLAGDGRCGFADGPATQSKLCGPTEVVEAPGGALYFSDSLNRRLRKLEGGVVTTVAGSGANADGDGDALAASFKYPAGIHLLADGSVLIADRDANRIRRYVPGASPQLTTEAGTGVAGYLDGARAAMQLDHPLDVLADSGGGLYVTERHLVRRITGSSALVAGWNTAGYADSVFAASVRFNGPAQVSFSYSGYLILADPGNHHLRVVDPGNGTTASAPSGYAGFLNGNQSTAALWAPSGVAWLGGQSFVFSDANARLRKLTGDLVTNVTTDFSGGSWQRQAQDGAAGSARLAGPRGLTRTSTGELWWVEPSANLVRRLRSDGVVETVAGDASTLAGGYVNGAFGTARVSGPSDLVAADDGKIYVADRYNHAIRVFDPSSRQVDTAAGSAPPAAAGLVNDTLLASRFNQPSAITAFVDGLGHQVLVVGDGTNRVLRRIDLTAGGVTTFAGTASSFGSVDGAPGTGQLGGMEALCPDGTGGVFVAEQPYNRLRRADVAGTLTTPVASLPFTVRAVASADATTLAIAGDEHLALIDPTTGEVTTLFPAAANQSPVGYADGDPTRVSAWTIHGLVMTPTQIVFTDERTNRVRRYWR